MANTPDPKTETKTLTEEETKTVSGGAEGETPNNGITILNPPSDSLPAPNSI